MLTLSFQHQTAQHAPDANATTSTPNEHGKKDIRDLTRNDNIDDLLVSANMSHMGQLTQAVDDFWKTNNSSNSSGQKVTPQCHI